MIIRHKVHSLYSERLIPTPTFHPNFREITNAWHALQKNSCPEWSQKGEAKGNFNQLEHKAFSVSSTHMKLKAWHAGQRSVSTCSEYSGRTSISFSSKFDWYNNKVGKKFAGTLCKQIMPEEVKYVITIRSRSNVLSISLNNSKHLFSKVECCLVMFSCWVVKRTEHFAEQG